MMTVKVEPENEESVFGFYSPDGEMRMGIRFQAGRVVFAYKEKDRSTMQIAFERDLNDAKYVPCLLLAFVQESKMLLLILSCCLILRFAELN